MQIVDAQLRHQAAEQSVALAEQVVHDPGCAEMALKAVRDYPRWFAIMGSPPLDRLSVWHGPIRGRADRVDLVQFSPGRILRSKALRFYR